jgi:hypothetical protein
MQLTDMLYGERLLKFAGFPSAEVLGPDASEGAIKALIDRCGSVFVKPVFKRGGAVNVRIRRRPIARGDIRIRAH